MAWSQLFCRSRWPNWSINSWIVGNFILCRSGPRHSASSTPLSRFPFPRPFQFQFNFFMTAIRFSLFGSRFSFLFLFWGSFNLASLKWRRHCHKYFIGGICIVMGHIFSLGASSAPSSLSAQSPSSLPPPFPHNFQCVFGGWKCITREPDSQAESLFICQSVTRQIGCFRMKASCQKTTRNNYLLIFIHCKKIDVALNRIRIKFEWHSFMLQVKYNYILR